MTNRDNPLMKPRNARFAKWGRSAALGAALLACACAARAEDESVSGTAAAAASVDMRTGDMTIIGASVAVGYSPSWSSVTNADAYVRIDKVAHADMFNATTSTVATLSAGDSGTCLFSLSAGDEPCSRLLHRAYSAGGDQIGETLVRDVAFGCEASASAASCVDCRAAALQEAVAARAKSPVMLTYDTSWATNGVPAAVAIESRILDGEGGAVIGSSPFFSEKADACGEKRLAKVGKGWLRLALTVKDSSDNILLEYITGDFLLKEFATMISIR